MIVDKVSMVDVNHRREDFSGLRSSWWVVAYSRFEECSFRNLRISGAELGGGKTPSVFVDCSFDGSRFANTGLGRLRFERCTFRDAVLKRWISHHVEFVDCVFSGNLDQFTLFGSMGDVANEITGNDLSEATMLGGGFRAGVDLTQQRLPTDPRHVYIGSPASTLKAAYEAVMQWEEDEDKGRAARLLRILAEDYHSGQEQLLLCPKTRPGDEVADRRLLELVKGIEARNTAP